VIDPLRLRRWVVWLGLPLAVLGLVGMVLLFELIEVPDGMDTMLDSLPPGTVLVLMRHPLAVEPGSVVLLALPEPIGGTLLTRVETVAADGTFTIRHDNRTSRYAELEARGPWRLADVRGTVFTQFVPERDAALPQQDK
jgi:hypothetical protein